MSSPEDDAPPLGFPKPWYQSTNIRWALGLFTPGIVVIVKLLIAITQKGMSAFGELSGSDLQDVGTAIFAGGVGVVWIRKRIEAGKTGAPHAPIGVPAIVATVKRLTGNVPIQRP